MTHSIPPFSPPTLPFESSPLPLPSFSPPALPFSSPTPLPNFSSQPPSPRASLSVALPVFSSISMLPSSPSPQRFKCAPRVRPESRSSLLAEPAKRALFGENSPKKINKVASSPHLSKKKGCAVASPQLITDYTREGYADLLVVNEGGFFDKGTKLKLMFVGEGKHHKCWLVMGIGKKMVIKTFSGNLESHKRAQVCQDTREAYNLLAARTDLAVAKLHLPENIEKDGFYVYDYISGRLPVYSPLIKNFLVSIFRDESLFVEDFRPDNVRVKDNTIIVIDPTKVDKKCSASIYIAQTLANWFKVGGTHDREEIFKAVEEFDQEFQVVPLDPKQAEAWQSAKEKIAELVEC